MTVAQVIRQQAREYSIPLRELCEQECASKYVDTYVEYTFLDGSTICVLRTQEDY